MITTDNSIAQKSTVKIWKFKFQFMKTVLYRLYSINSNVRHWPKIWALRCFGRRLRDRVYLGLGQHPFQARLPRPIFHFYYLTNPKMSWPAQNFSRKQFFPWKFYRVIECLHLSERGANTSETRYSTLVNKRWLQPLQQPKAAKGGRSASFLKTRAETCPNFGFETFFHFESKIAALNRSGDSCRAQLRRLIQIFKALNMCFLTLHKYVQNT